MISRIRSDYGDHEDSRKFAEAIIEEAFGQCDPVYSGAMCASILLGLYEREEGNEMLQVEKAMAILGLSMIVEILDEKIGGAK